MRKKFFWPVQQAWVVYTDRSDIYYDFHCSRILSNARIISPYPYDLRVHFISIRIRQLCILLIRPELNLFLVYLNLA